jgi:hypothetical protein
MATMREKKLVVPMAVLLAADLFSQCTLDTGGKLIFDQDAANLEDQPPLRSA